MIHKAGLSLSHQTDMVSSRQSLSYNRYLIILHVWYEGVRGAAHFNTAATESHCFT